MAHPLRRCGAGARLVRMTPPATLPSCAPVIREYAADDEASWLRCRVLAFLGTCYYDDVWPTRREGSQIQLVAAEDGEVVGICDIEIENDLATIDVIAVHPDHQRRGIANALLATARERLPEQVTCLDAWTREDEEALAWYRSAGFTESDHYLHVHKNWDEPAEGFTSPDGLSAPVMAFCHARIEDEAALRERYARVYVCRRMSLPLTGG